MRAFQRDLGVPETGVVDVATLQAIYARGISTGVAGACRRPTALPGADPTAQTTDPPPTTAAPPPAGATDTDAPTTTEPPTTERGRPLRGLVGRPEFSTLVDIPETAGYGRPRQPGSADDLRPTNDAFAGIDLGLTPDVRPGGPDELLRNLAVEGAMTSDELVTARR